MSATRDITPLNQTARRQLLQAGGALLAVALVFSQPAWTAPAWHEAVEMTGTALVLACIFGRLWSILYVGGRKNAELVTDGPFSMTRNPLYVFSCLGAAGVGLMFGSLLAALALALAAWLALSITAQREATFLAQRFGAAYAAYAARTPFFWPDPRLFHAGTAVSFSPRILGKTFVDTLWVLAAFPAVEALETLHEAGLLPTVFVLY
jgi:protein-S-isoprenylcysteine O-methyltransferase Ste14